MADTERHMDIHGDVRSVAGYLGWKHSDVMEADDIEQEIWVTLLETENYISDVADRDRDGRREALTRIGAQAVFREKQSKALFIGAVEYGAAEIRKSVDKVFKALFVDEKPPEHESVHKDNFLEGLEILTERCPRYLEIIMAKYGGDNEDPPHRRQLTRAVDALTDAMNTAHRARHVEYEDGPGTRTVISNSTAQVVKSRDYAGDFDGSGANSDFGKDIA